jgi:hypothetical protein
MAGQCPACLFYKICQVLEYANGPIKAFFKAFFEIIKPTSTMNALKFM